MPALSSIDAGAMPIAGYGESFARSLHGVRLNQCTRDRGFEWELDIGHAGVSSAVRGSAAGQHRSKLGWALGLTLAYMAAELVGGLITGSLALLADAAHMLTDAGGLALALAAIRFAERPATPQKTYGYLRFEILSALANAVVLLLLTFYILYEAYQRFLSPPEIQPSDARRGRRRAWRQSDQHASAFRRVV